MNALKKYLTLNSLFSAVCGIVMLVFPEILNGFFEIENLYVFPVIGINLIAFSIFVWYVSWKQLTNKVLVNVISGLDGLWVLGSIIIVVFGLFNLSDDGYVLIILVAIWIGFLGYQQFKNNRLKKTETMIR